MKVSKLLFSLLLLSVCLLPQLVQGFGCYSADRIIGGIYTCNVVGTAWVGNCTLDANTRLTNSDQLFSCSFTTWADNTSILYWTCRHGLYGEVLHQGQATIQFGEFIISQHSFTRFMSYGFWGGVNNCGCGDTGSSNHSCYS